MNRWRTQPRAPATGRASRERGITLVELMVAMLVTSLLLVFLLTVQTQLSQGFRGQSVASEVNSNMRMAAGAIRRDLAHAGYLLPAGQVEVAPDIDPDSLLQGFRVRNDPYGDGPDELHMIFGDDGQLALINGIQSQAANVQIDIDDPSTFDDGDIVILSSLSAACLLKVTGTNPEFVTVNPSGAPFNDSGDGTTPNPHCDNLRQAIIDEEPSHIYRFTGRSYRIDPERPEAGVLQMSPSGGLVPDDWVNVGVGFTNLQVATRYFEEGRTVDLDGDGDPERNWYSGDNQENPPPGAVPIAVSISLETRSRSQVGDVPTPATPAFIDLDRPDHNPIGDFGQACPGAALDPCGVDLAGTSDGDRPERYAGDHLYRWTTVTVNLRNMHTGDPPTLGGDDGEGDEEADGDDDA